jgi:hypothetical protein
VSITLSGSVRDAQSSALLPGVEVQVTSGADASRSTTTEASGNYSLPSLKVGTFAVRFSRPGFEIVERVVSTSQDTRLDVQLRPGATCMALPTPTGLRVSVSGRRVRFEWNPVEGRYDYLVGVGTSPGSSATLSRSTTQTTYDWRNAPAGTYFARVGTRSGDCPHTGASNEITFTVNQ